MKIENCSKKEAAPNVFTFERLVEKVLTKYYGLQDILSS